MEQANRPSNPSHPLYLYVCYALALLHTDTKTATPRCRTLDLRLDVLAHHGNHEVELVYTCQSGARTSSGEASE
jgi:hypothetical protein